ncbi:MAG: hypothetical protein BGP24_07630 [Lysobacterales bacterium 69-70]|nr:hypothetical protein [Xanthomonadaceae bacterium]OJY93638.1 MAG: hypothetical protein BGP24_07630 [Xanthomonadales bacterium 69-70]
MSFGTMPTSWVAEGALREFSPKAGVLGRHLAALKCYLTIAAHHRANESGVVLAYPDIGEIAKLSKPSIIEGLEILRSMELIRIESKASRNTNRYVFPELAKNFRKIPQDRVFCFLREFSNRHPRYLDALKAYFTYLHLRDHKTGVAVISHKRLVEYTGIRPESVAAANSVLAACHFVQIRTTENWGAVGHPNNEYTLLGDFAGGLPTRLTRVATQKAERKVDDEIPF